MKKLLLLAALISAAAFAQTTVTIPAQTATVKIPAQSVTVTIPAQTLTLPATTPPVVTPPVVTPPVVIPPAAGAFWLLNAGKFVGAGDCAGYSFGSGTVTCGQTAVVIGDEGWQPRMPNDDFDTTGYTYLTVSIRPTQAGNTWVIGSEMILDKPFPGCPNMISLMKYGPSPAVVGQWNTYKVPLAAMCITPDKHPYKVGILEQSSTNKAGNRVEFDLLGFLP